MTTTEIIRYAVGIAVGVMAGVVALYASRAMGLNIPVDWLPALVGGVVGAVTVAMAKRT